MLLGTTASTHSVAEGRVVPGRPYDALTFAAAVARVLLKGGGGSKGGGWVGLCPPPPPAGDPELLEAPKAPKKFFGLN